MRDDVLMSLVDRAMSDEEFRRRASEDLEGALRDYGYELTDEELAAVRDFHGQVAGKSDEELVSAIADAHRQGGG